jgi:hypothetical protein
MDHHPLDLGVREAVVMAQIHLTQVGQERQIQVAAVAAAGLPVVVDQELS